MLGEDLPEFRNSPLFPGPGGVEVGLSQEGGTLGGRGGKGPFPKQMLLALEGKLLSEDFSRLADNPQLWKVTNKTVS